MFIVLFAVSAAFAVLSLRLFRTARASKGAEGWLGLAFLCVAVLMPLRFVIQRTALVPEPLEPTFLLGGHALMAMGLSAFTLFVGRVFRPGVAWAVAVSAILIGAQIVSLPLLVLFGGHRDEQSLSVLTVGLVRALPFAWGFVESLRYRRLMQRRQALGLADAVVANRFGLFAIWTGSLVGLPLVLFTARVWILTMTEHGRMIGPDGTLSGAGWLLVAGLVVFGGATTISLWLSFFPPTAWIARVQAKAAAAA